MRIRSTFVRCMTLAVLAGLAAACATKPLKKADLSKKDAAAADKSEGPDVAYVPGTDVTEASLRGSEFGSTDALAAVHFDYDSATLQGPALETLKANAEYIKAHPEEDILVAGHCDERGTVEYNLALGQKRAREVREHYMRLGVSGKTVATISYGKENPACKDSNEACWASNRRAETRVRARVANAKPNRQDAR